MLKPINCPSYVKTEQPSQDGDYHVDIAIVPWDEFHFFTATVVSNNRQVYEANQLIVDFVEATKKSDNEALTKIFNRAKKYIQGE